MKTPDEREAVVVGLAQRLVSDLAQDMLLTPEVIRREFLKAVGLEALAATETETHVELDFTRTHEYTLGITFWVRDRALLNRLLPQFDARYTAFVKDGANVITAGGVRATNNEDASTRARSREVQNVLALMALRSAGTSGSRIEKLDRRAIVDVLAVHFLSHTGGGRLTVTQATDLVTDHVGEIGLAGWPRSFRRLRQTLVDRFGPLGPADT